MTNFQYLVDQQQQKTVCLNKGHGEQSEQDASSSLMGSTNTAQTTAVKGSGKISDQRRCRFISDKCLKMLYLLFAIMLSTAIIIECILLHLIILPYLAESAFEKGMCRYIVHEMVNASEKCENKCTKDHSAFPCAKIKVRFKPNDTSNGARERDLFIYDYYGTYLLFKYKQCALSPCAKLETDNQEEVIKFVSQFEKSQQTWYSCSAMPLRYDPTAQAQATTKTTTTTTTKKPSIHESGHHHDLTVTGEAAYAAAILVPTNNRYMFFNALFWPFGVFLIGLASSLFLYYIDSCQVWGSDNTVIA